MQIADLADEIYRELGKPAKLSIPSIAFWLTSNIGSLNNLLGLSVVVTDTLQFDPELTPDETSIFKQLYFLTYWTRKIDENLGAAAFDSSVVEVTEGDRTIRLVNRNEVAKTFQSMRKDVQTQLNQLIGSYKINRALPVQVAGNEIDEIWGMNHTLAGRNWRGYYDLS